MANHSNIVLVLEAFIAVATTCNQKTAFSACQTRIGRLTDRIMKTKSLRISQYVMQHIWCVIVDFAKTEQGIIETCVYNNPHTQVTWMTTTSAHDLLYTLVSSYQRCASNNMVLNHKLAAVSHPMDLKPAVMSLISSVRTEYQANHLSC